MSKIDALESIRFLSLRLRDNLPPWCANYAELREKYSKLCALVGPDDEGARVIGERLKYALRECEALSREAIELYELAKEYVPAHVPLRLPFNPHRAVERGEAIHWPAVAAELEALYCEAGRRLEALRDSPAALDGSEVKKESTAKAKRKNVDRQVLVAKLAKITLETRDAPLSQNMLARELGVAPSTLSKLKQSDPNIRTVLHLYYDRREPVQGVRITEGLVDGSVEPPEDEDE